MSELMSQIGFLLLGAAEMLVLLGFGFAVIMPSIDRWSKRFFIAFFAVLVLYGGLGILEEIINILADLQSAKAIVYYFETLLVSVLMPMMTAYLLHCCREDWLHSALFRLVTVLWIVFFLMLDISPFVTWFYSLSPDHQFYRGPLYSVIITPLIVIQVINLTSVIRWRSKLSKRYFCAFLIGLLPMTVAMFILFYISAFTFFAFSLALCALSMFAIILFSQIEQYVRQQKEIAHQRASIMILQMRPHFIYNTMMTIYYLCKQNPDLAQQVTLDFTTYLRKNFTAIASEELIPFSVELEHTRAYLAVEQAQFEDSLLVDFDTPHLDFRLPPLTLQPIVENAIKHGMDPDSEPLHILIRSRRANSGNIIIVENNGTDFKPADENEPHIALNNIQQRLEIMCRGKMTIAPRRGGGTLVKLTIPWQY
ncbi:MAG: histidine kinase [Blautia sp.]|nr:histidine kinase [Blautia sp.]